MRLLAIALLITACDADESLTSYGGEGTWRLTHLNDQAFQASATIAFADGGQVRGSAPCNNYSAQQTSPYPWFTLSPILATKRACRDLGAEQDFFATLTKMTQAEISGDVLILGNDTGEQLQFTKQSDG